MMFWIHGGAFTGGTGADPTFEGGNMGSRDVVMVAINYRLSTLRIITVLDWIRAHIAGFGGDPNHITIFGQSAGAVSVRAILASPKAIGKHAIVLHDTGRGFCRCETDPQCYRLPRLYNTTRPPESL